MKALMIFKRLRRKVVLKFDDDEALQCAIDGAKWKSLVWDFDQYLRGEYKYNDNEAAYNIRERLREMANDENLTIE